MRLSTLKHFTGWNSSARANYSLPWLSTHQPADAAHAHPRILGEPVAEAANRDPFLSLLLAVLVILLLPVPQVLASLKQLLHCSSTGRGIRASVDYCECSRERPAL